MEMISADSLKVAIILVPGFLAIKIRDFFAPKGSESAFEQLMQAVAFSVANFTLYSFLVWPWWPPKSLSSMGSLQLLSGLGLTSCLLGLGSGVVVGKDWHYRLARALRLTARTGRTDVWQDVFEDIRGSWLTVHLDDGQRVLGWARYYSDEGRRPSSFLRQASWIADDGTTTSIDGEGILLTELSHVKYVEFLGKGTNEHDDA